MTQNSLHTSSPPKTKRILVRAIVSCLLLVYLLRNTQLDNIWLSVKTASPLWLFLAFFLHIVGLAITAWRWQMLLDARGSRISVWYLLRSVLIGVFFNSFLPSTVGGDVYRAFDTVKYVGSKTEAMTIVVVERLTGIFALGLFAVAALFLGFSHFGNISIVWLALGGLGVLFLLFLAAMNHRVARTAKALFEHPEMLKIAFFQKVRAKLQQIYTALLVYKHNRPVMLVAFFLAMLLQLNVILHYYCIAYALRLSVPFTYFFLVIPVVTIILMLPIFINGIGGREALFVAFFGQFGVESSTAIAFTWIAFGLVLLYGVFGGLLYALRKD